MASPTDDELKARAAFCLKRVTEISSSATKTAIVSFSALAVIWFGQIHPQYQVLHKVYPLLKQPYEDVMTSDAELQTIQEEIKKGQTRNAGLSAGAPTASKTVSPKRISYLEGKAAKQQETVGNHGAELASLVNTISFEVFGLKLPVPPLWAAVVWNILLLALLLYLAQSRAAVWRLCGEGLSTLKKLGKNTEELDEIAGSGPVWIAPAPSRPAATTESVTIDDLRSAFGWNRLETLPSIAATAGFLLLGLLQLAVTSEGLAIISKAQAFTNELPAAESQIDQRRPDSLDDRIAAFTSSLGKVNNQSEVGQLTAEPKLAHLVIRPAEASLLSLLLFLMMTGTLMLVVWWFRPSSVPTRVARGTNMPRRLAGSVLSVIGVVLLVLGLGGLAPERVSSFGTKLAYILPNVTRFLAASVVSFCVIELAFLAFSPTKGAMPLVDNGKTN
jgi:hypothetical protein